MPVQAPCFTSDVDRIARELDFITLQEYISTVTFCDIAAVPDVDCQIAKLFKLAQFTIEYLLHSQEYLQSVINEYEAKMELNTKEKCSLQEKVEELEANIVKLKDENKKRRKMIQQQQMLIEAGASSYYQCPHCEKAFMNASFLQGHMQRRHPGCLNYIGDVIAHSQNEQARLNKHLKQLEKDLNNERETLDLKLLKAEEEKRAWTERSQREMDEWKEKEGARMKAQLDEMQQSFLAEVDMLKKKEETYQEQIADMQATMNLRQSHLGELVDDLESEKRRLREYEDKMLTFERLNEMKDGQIAELGDSVRGLRGETSMREEQERRLREQEKRVLDLQEQLRKKTSHSRVTQLQDEIDHLHSMMSGESDDSEESFDEDKLRRNRLAMLQSLKPQIMNHLLSLLNEKLRSSGVDPEAPGITSATLSRKLMVLKTERQRAAQDIPDYYQIRESTRRSLVDEASKLSRARASKRKPKRESPASRNISFGTKQPKRGAAPVSNPTFSPRNRQISFATDRPNPNTPVNRAATVEKLIHARDRTPTRSASQYNSILRPPQQPPTAGADVPPPSPFSSPSSADRDIGPTPVPRGGQKKQSSSPLQSDDDDISNWDDVSEILADDDEPVKQSNVKNLASKLERDLGRPKKKPPAGAVLVLPRNETEVEDFHLSDDDDLFSVTSSENENGKNDRRPGSSRAPPAGGLRKSVASNSSNTQGTSVWGSGQKPKEDIRIQDFDFDEIST